LLKIHFSTSLNYHILKNHDKVPKKLQIPI